MSHLGGIMTAHRMAGTLTSSLSLAAVMLTGRTLNAATAVLTLWACRVARGRL